MPTYHNDPVLMGRSEVPDCAATIQFGECRYLCDSLFYPHVNLLAGRAHLGNGRSVPFLGETLFTEIAGKTVSSCAGETLSFLHGSIRGLVEENILHGLVEVEGRWVPFVGQDKLIEEIDGIRFDQCVRYHVQYMGRAGLISVDGRNYPFIRDTVIRQIDGVEIVNCSSICVVEEMEEICAIVEAAGEKKFLMFNGKLTDISHIPCNDVPLNKCVCCVGGELVVVLADADQGRYSVFHVSKQGRAESLSFRTEAKQY